MRAGSGYLFFAVVFIIFTLPASSADITNLFKSVELEINTTKSKYNETICAAKREIYSLEERIHEKRSAEIYVAEKEIEFELQIRELTVAHQRRRAKKEDIIKCIESYEPRLRNLEKVLLKSTRNCISDEVKEVISFLKDTIALLIDSEQKVKRLPSRQAACKEAEKKHLCLKDVILDAARLTKFVPSQITRKLEEAYEYANGLSGRLTLCTQIGTKEARASGDSIVSSSDNCLTA